MNPTKSHIIAIVGWLVIAYLSYDLPVDYLAYRNAGLGIFEAVIDARYFAFYYPYYILPLLEALAWLPVQSGYMVWMVINLVAYGASINLLKVKAWAWANPLLYTLVSTGQASGLITLGAVLLYTKRHGGLGVLLVMLKPHIGLFMLGYRIRYLLSYRAWLYTVGIVLALSFLAYGLWFDDMVNRILHVPTAGNASLWQIWGWWGLIWWGLMALPLDKFKALWICLPLATPYIIFSDWLIATILDYRALAITWCYYALSMILFLPYGVIPMAYALTMFYILVRKSANYGHVTANTSRYPHIPRKTVFGNVLSSYRAWHLRIR